LDRVNRNKQLMKFHNSINSGFQRCRRQHIWVEIAGARFPSRSGRNKQFLEIFEIEYDERYIFCPVEYVDD
jgi:hypothetical protein